MHDQKRKSYFKTPPVDKEASQHARRDKALEEQKRRRAQNISSSRNLDLFAGLSLGSDEDIDDEPEIIPGNLAQFAPLLPSSNADPQASSTDKPRKIRKPDTRYANRIMYAELLEMKDDPTLQMSENKDGVESDGLPVDLDTNWIALAPVPQGKRCLAVANHSPGVPGTFSKTSLKSRMKGRTILTFPSPLPPSTLLDCILDENWRQNGILHVLDIVKWKGRDFGDCEANFRFWWRDTRLSELTFLPPSAAPPDLATSLVANMPQLRFYPTMFLPVPYHLDLSFSSLLSSVIPLSRSPRQVTIQLSPLSSDVANSEMEIDQQSLQSATKTAVIQPDGLLLYISQASYEPGTSPLSSWVPIVSHEGGGESPLSLFERPVNADPPIANCADKKVRLVASKLSSSAQNEGRLTEVSMEL